MIEEIIAGHYTETESKTMMELPDNVILPMFGGSISGTVSGPDESSYITIINDFDIVQQAMKILIDTETLRVKEDALKLIRNIVEVIRKFENRGYDFSYFPPLNAANVEDGSVLVEWVFQDFRIGFTIEKEQEESGWYLVSNERLGKISATGSFSGIDEERIVAWLINFAISSN